MLTFEFMETSRSWKLPVHHMTPSNRHVPVIKPIYILKYNFGILPCIRISGVSVAVSMVLLLMSREEVTRRYIREDRSTSFVYIFPLHGGRCWVGHGFYLYILWWIVCELCRWGRIAIQDDVSSLVFLPADGKSFLEGWMLEETSTACYVVQ
ncbi:hypothetical protein M752DRAFT_15051 [Aspergillus phoenicis ATCC 13157]|uniref:Uncharacterized protein n=1 Tax=Aspergillus phoenicis ATCC 13157 TaxID=1353007 RepID=A0A370PJE0_ASPPH|nr:hypothetical protein M752DRAFT_15051 [Aspergillus phoenicis ATCC 13157]